MRTRRLGCDTEKALTSSQLDETVSVAQRPTLLSPARPDRST